MSNQKNNVKNYFDRLSLDYQKAYDHDKGDPVRTYIFNKRKEIVLSLIDQERARLLDIGCGPGVMTKELLRKNFIIYNTDISPAMIERATKDLGDHAYKNNVFFKVADIEHLDFEDSYFDVILCIGVIEYLNDYHKAIEIITKILKPGGTVIISIPNGRSMLNAIDDFLSTAAFKINPKLFNGAKSTRQNKVERRAFVSSGFVRELKKYGLSKTDIKFHGYRLATLRRFFPGLWISLSGILNRLNPTILAYFLANDCILKFKKEKNV